MIDIKENQDKIEELLIEFKQNRDSLKSFLIDLQVIKEKIDLLFPEKLDNRYVRFFEDRFKSITELFKTLLEIRKEIGKSLKEEIELRRKINIESQTDNMDMDIRELAEKIQELSTN